MLCTYLLLLCLCSIEYALSMIDQAIQFGEDADVKIKDEDPPGE